MSPKSSRQSVTLRGRALGLLARREHSRLELARKLAPHAESAEQLEALLDELAASGWLSEQRVVEQVMHARRGKFGSRRIRQELIDKGVAAELVAAAETQLREGDAEAARALWQRKFGQPPRSAAERARQIRFMQGRGFALETVMRIIRQGRHNDDDG